MPPFRLEMWVYLAYLALGPLTWWFYGFMLYAGRRKMLLLKRPPEPTGVPPPGVTILIPAKDEGERIRACISSCLGQDYPNFDVIAIDDRSTDNTGAVMDELAAADPKLKVLHVKDPPAPGWTGKNNALHQGAKGATGDWLLFVDSDVILETDALSASISCVLRKKFDLISLLPRLESHTLWESLLVPLAGSAASSMYLIALNNNMLWNKTAFANGQYLMISRPAYEAMGGHETVRDRYCEDIEIARQLKARGLRPRIAWGNEFSAVRMYSSLEAIFRGWGRIFYSAQLGSPWRILAAVAFVLCCCFSLYPAIGWGVYRLLNPSAEAGRYAGQIWLLTAAGHFGVMTYLLGVMYHWSGNPRRNAWLFPLGGGMLLAIFFKALKMCVTKKVEWRGTAYSHVMATDLGAAAAQGQAKAN